MSYKFAPNFTAGVEYNPLADEVSPIANWIVQTGSATRPLISFGTSSDRIGTAPPSRSYNVTFAQSYPQYKLAPYVSVMYSEFDDDIKLPFGCNYQFTDEVSALYMMDGVKSHALLTYKQADYSVSLMWIWMKHPGISISFGF